MRGMRTVAFIIFLIFIPLSVSGSDIAFIRTEQTVIFFEKPLRSLADELSAIYPGVKSDLEKLTGWTIGFRPEFLLLRHQNFKSVIGNRHVVAVAIGQDYRIIIDSSKMTEHPFTLSVTVKHELAHLLLHHKISRTHLPRWLDEGFAQWVSDGISEIITGSRTYLTSAVIQNSLIPIRELTVHFPQDEIRMILAYEQSRSLVNFIHKKFGDAALLKILNDMADGNSADDALRKNLSVSSDTLEDLWQKDLKGITIWFYYVSAYIYEIVFFLAAVLAVMGFVRYRIRLNKWRDDDEEEEERNNAGSC